MRYRAPLRVAGRARKLHETGRDPDYRFSLANERTFLAWLRTALGLVAGGIAVIALVPSEVASDAGRRLIGFALLILGLIVSASSYRAWYRNERALRMNEALPASPLPKLVAGGLTAVIAALIVLLVFAK